MNTLIRLLGCLVMTSTFLISAPAPETFITSLRSALESGKIDSVKSLYDFNNTPPAIQQDLLKSWSFTFKDLENGWTIKSIIHLEKSVFIKQGEDAAEKITMWTTPKTMGGKSYVINAEITGVIVITLSPPEGHSKQEKTFPVGTRSDGTLAIAAIKEVK